MHDWSKRRRVTREWAVLFAGLIVASVTASVAAQPPAPNPSPKFNVLEQLPGLPGAGGFEVAEPVVLTARLEAEKGGPAGKLIVEATIEPEWHLYSVTQQPGGPLPSKITVTADPPLVITGTFQPDKPPKVRHLEEFAGVDVEEHADRVVWTAAVRVPDGVDPSQYRLQVKFNGQTCRDGDSCVQVRQTLTPKLTGFIASGETKAPSGDASTNSSATTPTAKATAKPAGKPGPYRNRPGHVEINGYIEPKVAKPGSQVKLVLTAKPDPHWHVYAYATEDIGGGAPYKPTLISARLPKGWTGGEVSADSAPVIKAVPGLPPTPYHEKPVAWTLPITIPADASGTVSLTGLIGFQACENSCDPPAAAEFQVDVTIGAASEPGRVPLSFAKSSYSAAADLAANPQVASGDEPATSRGQETVASPAERGGGDANSNPPVTDASSRKWSNIKEIKGEQETELNLGSVLLLSLVGGFLLNFMPCVLPVIGLKVMAFMNQGHGSRRQIFMLNLYYVIGQLAVFMVLATLAVVFHLGWGEQFQSNGFNIALAAIVFVFALSMLGVWEIPLPGFVGTGKAAEMAEHEGAFGAFCKGAFTTVLATPCTGPFMGTALTWASKQPAPVIFATFFALGLGMGLPYLLIGAFPQMIRFLPKPGAWMDTFKQIMGFVLLGTVVFIYSFLKKDYLVATTGLLVGLGIACWWVARTPGYAEFGAKLKAWSIGAVIATAIGWLSFTLLGPTTAIVPWKTFSRAGLEDEIKKGNTVLVDFTADWCLVCKTNEAVALNTKTTLAIIKKHGIVPIKADKTHDDEVGQAVDQLLIDLGHTSTSIPYLVIFPGNGDPPIAFSGPVTQRMVSDALEKSAVASAANKNRPVAATGMAAK